MNAFMKTPIRWVDIEEISLFPKALLDPSLGVGALEGGVPGLDSPSPLAPLSSSFPFSASGSLSLQALDPSISMMDFLSLDNAIDFFFRFCCVITLSRRQASFVEKAHSSLAVDVWLADCASVLLLYGFGSVTVIERCFERHCYLGVVNGNGRCSAMGLAPESCTLSWTLLDPSSVHN